MQESPNVVADMARNHIGRPMKMIVYNARSDSTREVTIIPGNNWGGKTLLGNTKDNAYSSINYPFV